MILQFSTTLHCRSCGRTVSHTLQHFLLISLGVLHIVNEWGHKFVHPQHLQHLKVSFRNLRI